MHIPSTFERLVRAAVDNRIDDDWLARARKALAENKERNRVLHSESYSVEHFSAGERTDYSITVYPNRMEIVETSVYTGMFPETNTETTVTTYPIGYHPHDVWPSGLEDALRLAEMYKRSHLEG